MRQTILFLAILFCAVAANAATYTAAGCTQANLSAIIATEQASKADGDIIAIPSGTCTWTGTQHVNQTFSNSVTIQGAGAVSSTTGGASTTGSDLTTIIDNTNGSNGSLLNFTTTSGKSFRQTGIYIEGNGSSTQETNGVEFIGGQSTAVRVDHCHFFINNNLSQGLAFGDGVEGVADHNYFQSNAGDLTNDIGFRNGLNWKGASDGQGHDSWADGDNWGTSQFIFVEDSRFFDGDPGEVDDSGRGVFRHNTVTGSASTNSGQQIYWHGQQTGSNRGGRAFEMYDNTFTQNGNNSNPALSLNSGTALIWGNTETGGYQGMVQISYNFRNNSTGGGNYTYPPPPAGWGFCGSAAGGPTNWDGNHNSTSGYPCIGQPGRGKGDLLSGSFNGSTGNLINTTTGTVAWPHEALTPIYVWDNVYTPQFYTGSALAANDCADADGSDCTNNVDYYVQFGNGGNVGSFNGTVGIGQGLLSARPATCTGGTDPMTSGAAPGVGYWATDTNTLYVCNPTNTWTAYYTPYTYPNPLTNGGGGPPPGTPKGSLP